MASEAEIRDAYLETYVGDRSKAERCETLAQLGTRARESGYSAWAEIIEARVAHFDGRTEEVLTLIDQVLAEHPENAYALFVRARALEDLPERRVDAVQVYARLCALLKNATEIHSLRLLGMAMVNRGANLLFLERPDEALEACQAVIDRFGDASEEELRRIVSDAHRMKAVVLAIARRPEAAEAKQSALATTPTYVAQLKVYQELALARLKDRLDSYLEQMKAAERDRGGGYLIYHGGKGIVIDPGYSFIENFYTAGGRMCDVDAIVVTHAHDDHTAELEPLLVLVHQYNSRQNQGGNRKRVRLYLSQGCARKFAGILQLRDDPKIESVTTLSRPGPGCVQELPIGEEMRLTVLPAYHDDVVTRDTAVGLGFEFRLGDDSWRKILFTGDTSYYPQHFGPDGAAVYYDPPKNTRPKLDKREGQGLHEQYPEAFRDKLDLVVAHIGSIKRQELEPPRAGEDLDAEQYYENHLGLLGTLTLLDRLSPRAAIVSEFGSELRDFRIELVGQIGEALRDKQQRDGNATTPSSFRAT